MFEAKQDDLFEEKINYNFFTDDDDVEITSYECCVCYNKTHTEMVCCEKMICKACLHTIAVTTKFLICPLCRCNHKTDERFYDEDDEDNDLDDWNVIYNPCC